MNHIVTIYMAGIVFRLCYVHTVCPPKIPHAFLYKGDPQSANIIIRIDQKDYISPIPLMGEIIKTPAWEVAQDSERYYFNIYDKSILLATLTIDTSFTSAYIETTQLVPETGLPYICAFAPIISGYLLYNNLGCMFHGAAVNIGDKCIVLTGPSGVGKSTLSAILNDSRFDKFADDRLIITKQKNIPYCSSTPFDLKLSSWVNRTNQIQAILTLSHSKTGENVLRKSNGNTFIKQNFFSNFAPLFVRDWMPSHYRIYVDLFYRLPVYDYEFVPDESAAVYLTNRFGREN